MLALRYLALLGVLAFMTVSTLIYISKILIGFEPTLPEAHLIKSEVEDPGTKTLGMVAVDPYEQGVLDAFGRGAKTACKGRYTIIVRTRDPWTLDGYLKTPDQYFWVVSCGEKGDRP